MPLFFLIGFLFIFLFQTGCHLTKKTKISSALVSPHSQDMICSSDSSVTYSSKSKECNLQEILFQCLDPIGYNPETQQTRWFSAPHLQRQKRFLIQCISGSLPGRFYFQWMVQTRTPQGLWQEHNPSPKETKWIQSFEKGMQKTVSYIMRHPDAPVSSLFSVSDWLNQLEK